MTKPNPALPRSFTAFSNGGLLRVLESTVHVHAPLPPGSYNPIALGAKEFTAIWDTGATQSAISEKVINDCGLKPIDVVDVQTASGKNQCFVYLVSIFLPNGVIFRNVRATGAKLSSCDALIGMDIIVRGDFAVTNFNGRTVFSFRMPSQKTIDFTGKGIPSPVVLPTVVPQPAGNPMPPSSIGAAPVAARPAIRKYDPCPCGSGLKYKWCHFGKPLPP